MKIYKLNSLTTFLFAFVVVGLVVFLPIVLIESLWNTTVAKTYTDISIDFWQALILWLIVLVLLNIIGIFKFEFAVETHNSIIDDELLNKKLQDLQAKSNENTDNGSKKSEIDKK